MPLTKKGRTILASMKTQYGKEKGEEVFWRSVNAGTISGVHAGRRRRRKKRYGS